ncbi:MAG: ribosomal protein [Candidatus Berkelbacteria bacterium]|nr:ribosomal protein [Candidatus Berkelbacteria bacterium]
MHKPEGYKELLVYKRADELRDFVIKITENFSYDERRRKEHFRDSARSVKQNIVEGWKRSTTKEYYDFLSFSLGSLAEIKEDNDDSLKDGLISKEVHLRLKNKCREEDYLLNRLKLSLHKKVENEGTLPTREKYHSVKFGEKQNQKDFDSYLDKLGLKKLEDGRFIQEKGEKGERGEK